MIGAALTWLSLLVVLVLFAARAWVVETNRGRLTTAGAAQRGLTWAVAAAVVLIGMATFNGGLTLTGLLLNGEARTGTPSDTAPVAPQPAAPAPAAPVAPANP